LQEKTIKPPKVASQSLKSKKLGWSNYLLGFVCCIKGCFSLSLCFTNHMKRAIGELLAKVDDYLSEFHMATENQIINI
jgi:hypothetical protein